MLYYLILINAVGLAFMYLDKQKARYHRWRIPEAALLTLAVFGGSPGIFLGMSLFRHKTKHWKFSILLPILIAAQIILCIIWRGSP